MEPLSSGIRLPEIPLDRQSREPLHQQITRQVAKAIREGNLGRGCRLPSTRLLARMLSVSRNTVLVADESLAADDLIHNVHGSGAHVNKLYACDPADDDGPVIGGQVPRGCYASLRF